MEPTTDHKTIRRWAESRRALPAFVRGTNDGEPAVLRFIIPGAHFNNRDLVEVTWEDFFAKFDLLALSFVYQEMTPSGEPSMHNEILQREQRFEENRSWN